MRTQKNECSFVSLRDIQRVLKIIHWFMHNGTEIFKQMSRKKNIRSRKYSETQSEESDHQTEQNILEKNVIEENIPEETDIDEKEDDYDTADEESDQETMTSSSHRQNLEDQSENLNLITSIILALNTCYHVGLQSDVTRKEYRDKVSEIFIIDNSRISADYFLEEINCCYEVVFLF
jgi:hypothetical protein